MTAPARMRSVAAAVVAAALVLSVGVRGSARDRAPSKRKSGSGERVNMIPASPLLNLKIDIQYCQYDVYVNGGLVTRNLEGNPANEDQPINHWLRSGSNEIEVQTHRAGGEPDTCDIKVALVIKDADDEKAPGATALVLGRSAQGVAAGDPTAGSTPAGRFDSHAGFHPSDKGDLEVGPAQYANRRKGDDQIDVLSRTFDVHLPFPEWAFWKGEKMKRGWEFKNRDEMMPVYNQILAAYVKVWSLLDKHDINGFLDACEERSHEMDLAYFKKPGETRSQLQQLLQSTYADASLGLIPVDPGPGKFWKYSVGSKGNLIALMQGSRGSGVIRFRAKDGSAYSRAFPVVFRKEGSRYIVTR